MDYSQKIINKENFTKPIILNNYSINNVIIAPLNIETYNNIPVNMKNIFNGQSKILYTTPKHKFVKRNIRKVIQLTEPNRITSPSPPQRVISKINYISLNPLPKENIKHGRQFSKVIPKIINITNSANTSREKHPQDSVKKIIKKTKLTKNYISKIEINSKKSMRNSLSQGELSKHNSNKKGKLETILSLKNINDSTEVNNEYINKSNKNPRDSKPIKKFFHPSKLNLKEFILDKEIGNGANGKIFSVKWIKNNRYYSLKKEILKDEYNVHNRNKTFKIIKGFNMKTGSKGVIKLYCNLCYKIKPKNNINIQVFNNNENIQYEYYILMEKAEKDWEKEICQRRKTDNYYTENELLNITFQLISVLSSLQKNHITHRDIKPQNILILNGRYKLCDFDEIRELEKDGLIVQRVRGSELYMSPILFNGLHQNLIQVKHNTYKSDVFSLGMCLFYAASLTYGGVDSIRELNDMNEIKNIIFNYLGMRYSEKFIYFILFMLEIDENKRPNFIQLEELYRKLFFH